MSLDIPDQWIVFTRTSEADDPNLKKFGLDKAGLDRFFVESNMYLNAVDLNIKNEILVTMDETEGVRKAFDLNLATDEEKTGAAEKLKNSEYIKNKAKVTEKAEDQWPAP